MKSFFRKAMFSLVLCVLCVVSANAQRCIDGTSMTEREIAALLTTNPRDTVMVDLGTELTDSAYIQRTQIYYRSGNEYITQRVNTISSRVKNEGLLRDLYKSSVDTRFVESLYDSRMRDVYYYEVEGLPGVMGADRHAGKIVARAANKYGWSFNAFVGYQFAENIIAPLGGLGVRFNQPIWMVGLTAELGQSKTSDVAQTPGEKYLTSRTEVGIGFQPFRLDKFNQHRLFVGAKLGWEWYKTDTAPDENGYYFRSEGNYLYPSLFLRYEYRMFATGNSWYTELSCSRKQYVLQEKWIDGEMIQGGKTTGMISVELKVGFDLGFGRDKTKNVTLKQLRK